MALALVLSGGVVAASAADDAASLGAPALLRVDGQSVDALLGTSTPNFSWAPIDSARGQSQTAYQITVSNVPTDTGDARSEVWDSTKVSSTSSTAIPYTGPALEADSTYEWSVRTWNVGDDASPWSAPQRFEVGPLVVGDWQTDWLRVGEGDLARSEFAIAKPVTRARLYVGAQGVIETHLNGALVDPQRVYDSSSTDFTTRVVYRSFDVTDQLDVGSNVLGAMLAKGAFSDLPTFIMQLSVTYDDGTSAIFGTDDSWTTTAGPVTATDFYYGESYDARLAEDGWDAAGFDDAAWAAVPVFAPVAGLTNLALNAPVAASDQITTNGWSPAALTDGIRFSTNGSEGFHSTVVTNANTSKWVQVDLGASTDVGQVTLFPANPTNDVLPYPGAGFPVRYQVQVSNDPAFGTFDVFADRSASDQVNPGTTPVTLDGDAAGRYVRVAATKLNCRDSNCTLRFAELGAYPTDGDPVFGYTALEADTTPPVRVVDTIEPLSQTNPATGVTVYDFGTDYVGQVAIQGAAAAGTSVVITKGELLKNGRVSTSNISFSDADATRQKDTYTFAGQGTESWHPSLNYAAFRYVEVSGVPAGTTLTVTGRVSNNDVKQTGSFSTSSPLLNQIQSALVRTQLNNLQQGMPLDCPTREKRGWMGDAGDTNAEAMANFDMQSFYDKWLGDVRTSQNANGSVPSVSPVQGRPNDFYAEPAWGSAYPQIVWDAYVQYGDANVLENNYDEVRDWVDWMGTISTNGIINASTPSWGDDWQATQSTPHVYFQTAFYIYDAQLLAKMATALGHTADAATYTDLASDLADSFNATYFTASSNVYGTGTQLSYAFPLFLGIVPAGHEDAVLAKLVKDIRDRNDHVSTGYAGTTIVYQALSQYDRNDVLLDVAERTDYPSFGYMVTTGPGTIWEKWVNSSAADGTSSKSHIGLAGSIGQWYYQQLAGIQPGAPGWTDFTLAPAIVGDLTHVEASQQTVRGTIASSWTRDGGDLSYEATIPVGSTATIELPATSVVAITEGNTLLADADGISNVSGNGELVTFTAASGSYEFHVSANGEAAAGAIDAADALTTHVASLVSTDDVTTDAAATLTASLDTVIDDTSAALPLLESDRPAAAAKVLSALAAARAVQARLAGEGISAGAVTALTPEAAALVDELEKLAASLSGLETSVALSGSGDYLPGDDLTATVTLTNSGDAALTNVAASLDLPEGWTVEGAATVPTLAAGQSTTLALHVTIGVDQLPADLEVGLAIAFDFGGTHLVTSTPVPLTVGSTAEVTAVSFDSATVSPTSATTATVTVTNNGTRAISGSAGIVTPAGWVDPMRSPRVTIAPGATVTLPVRVFVPTTLSDEVVDLTATFERGGVTLASKATTLTAKVLEPVPAAYLDHIDLGNTPSETAHALATSGDGGVNTESRTRRYSGSAANSYFQFSLTVPTNAPFVFSAVETYDGARLKEYTVTVNGVLVQSRLFQRKVNGVGLGVYQILVDNPAAFTTSGTKAVIRLTHTANANYDPSLADAYTMVAPSTVPAPTVIAQVTPTANGTNGWHVSAPTVSLAGQDFSGAAVTDLEIAEAGTFADYAEPVTVNAEGTTTLTFRGTAGALTSTVGSVQVKLDTVAPVTTGSLAGTTVTLAATDATSGVGATQYRLGSGDWQAYTAPFPVTQSTSEQTVSFRSTDVAGNAESPRSLTVPAATVPPVTVAPVVTLNPVASVSVTAGKRVTLTAAATGTPAPGVQWQSSKNGTTWTDIPGAFAGSYAFTAAAAQSGTRVRAVFTNSAGAVPTTATALTVKTVTKVTVSLKHASISKKSRATVVVTVAPTAKKATGTVTVKYGSKSKKVKLTASMKGRVSVVLPVLKKGKYAVSATYSGSSTLAGDASPKVSLRVR